MYSLDKMAPGASYCCVHGCSNNSKVKPHLTYFSVPKNEEMRLTWTKLIMREDILNSEKRCKYYVCSEHFEDSMLKNKRLTLFAIPTLKLPGKSEPVISLPSFVNSTLNIQEDYNSLFVKTKEIDHRSEKSKTDTAPEQSTTAEDLQISEVLFKPAEKRPKRDPKVSFISQSLNNIEDQVSALVQKKDYFDDFGLYIASLLRALSKERATATQVKIMDMIKAATDEKLWWNMVPLQ